MGAEVHCKSSFEGYYSMRDVNEDSNSSSWPVFYGDKSLGNGHYYNGFIPRTVADGYPGCDKDALKHKMLEHEAIFKNQVYELHRLYRRQRDMMEEVKRKEFHKHRISIDTSSSSSLLPSQKPYEEAQKWQIPSFPLTNSTTFARPSIFGADISNSPLSCSKGKNNNNSHCNSSKDCEIVDCRPSKVRKKLFDLEQPPDENIDHEEQEQIQYKQASEESSYKGASSSQCFRGSNGLADLNEPVHEEAIGHVSVDGLGPSAKRSGPQFLGPTHEIFEKSQSGRSSVGFNPLLLEGKGNGRDWLSSMRETGNSRSNMNLAPGNYSEISTRIQDHSRFNQTPLPFSASRNSTSYPYMNSSDLASSWGKPNGSLTQKLTSFQKQPPFLSSPQSHMGYGGDRWRTSGSYTPNGFYRGSSSGSKELHRLPSGGFDNRNSNNLDDRSLKFFKGSNFIDLTDNTKGMDLNTIENVSNDDKNSRKFDQTMLPWLQAKPICKFESPCDQFKDGEKGDSLVNNGKILGFPVFGNNSCVSKNESSSLVSTSASLRCAPENGKVKMEIEHRGFDINVAWDDDSGNKQIDLETSNLEKETITEIKKTENVEKVKNHFDLNSCLTEEEDILVPEKVKKMTMEIDLEAPAVPEVEEENIDLLKKSDDCEGESLEKVAAEVMVAISSQESQPGSTSEVVVRSNDDDNDIRLLWFVDVIENAGIVVSNEIDEYEELTLKLKETKEEEYMPKPLGPEICEPEELGPSAQLARPRRGQARRGRPRRDFQRDILPGLLSLSRHEVTEDLQIFGGLMRATGHSWNVGLTRRNGTRGRRKAAVEPPPPPPAATPPPPPPPLSEVVGWGKTTRRPRRQRSGSSSVVVPLT